jgi:hypothetical protein
MLSLEIFLRPRLYEYQNYSLPSALEQLEVL